MLKLSLQSNWLGTEELGCSVDLLCSRVCACALNILECMCPALRVISIFRWCDDCCGMADQSWGLCHMTCLELQRGGERESKIGVGWD